MMIRKKTLSAIILLFIPLSMMAHVSFKSPLGGETYIPGDEVYIEWEILIEHNTLNWDLYYTVDNGTTWLPIELDLDLNVLSYNWMMPELYATEIKLRIVQDNEDYDFEAISKVIYLDYLTALSMNKDLSFSVFPQPSEGTITINYPSYTQKNIIFELFNSNGQEVKELKNIRSDESYQLNIKPGIYVYRIRKGYTILYKSKLLVR